MALNQNFNLNPYYDDFDDDKQFLRVLFRPGYAVQARELTQLQSILQDQISKFGKHIFKNGSMVLGGESIFENTEIFYLRLENDDTNGNSVDVDNFLNKKITDTSTETVRALVVGVVPRDINAAAETTFAYNTLIIKYLSPTTFSESTNIKVDTDVTAEQYLATTIASVIKSPIEDSIYYSGSSSIAHINDGVFFYDGYFVKVLPQTIVLDPYGVTPTYRIGLEVNEEIIDENADTSLLDPALEASNYQAPGANRYKVSLTLAKREATSTDDSAFINLMKIENGKIQERVLYPQYAVLEDTLARRTFDESGNYIVGIDDFKVSFRDDTVSNGGVGFANSYNLLVSPGKAYVRGYEFETIAESPIVVRRARDYSNVTNYNLTFDYQNYIDVTNIQGPINFKELTSLNIHCVPAQSINTATKHSLSSTEMGTIRIRALDYVYGANSTSVANAVFRAYTFDANLYSIMGRTATPKIGFLNSVAVANSGDSAFGLPTLNVLGSNSSPATVTSNVKVVSVNIYNQGTGYAVGNTFTASGGTGTPAVLYVSAVGAIGNVTAVTITNPGEYTLNPTANLNPFTANTGSGTGFSANLRFGVSQVRVTAGGVNYDGQSASIVASGNGIANVVLYPSFTANANTITLDTESSIQDNAYRGVKIRILGYAKEYRANSFGNTTLRIPDVANTAVATGQRVFGPGIVNPTYVYSITPGSNTVTLTQSVPFTLVSNSFAFIKETEFRNFETRVINNYVGSSRIAYIADSSWSNVPNTSAIYSLDFEFKDAESFVTSNSANSLLTTINISEDSKYSVLTDDYEGAYLTETDFNNLIYRLPNKAIKENSIDNVEFSARQLYAEQFSSNVLTFSTTSGTQTKVNGSPLAGADAIENFFVVLRSPGTDLANGTVINFYENDTNNVSVTTSLGVSTVTIKVPGAGNALADVYAKVEYPDPQPASIRKRKIYKQANTQIIVTTGGEEILSPNCIVLHVNQPSQNGVQAIFSSSFLENLRTPNQPQTIYVSDVVSIAKILDFGTNAVTTANLATATDITTSYKFDNGQRDNSYEHASISLLPGKTAPSGNVVVFANYFAHENYGYFSVDSYESIGYSSIPTYVSPNSGEVYRLRDCIDFRPSRKNGLEGVNGKYNETYIGISGTSLQLDYSYYLPRIDKLVITRDKQFEVVMGQSALIPKVPKDRNDAMTLYTIFMPAYTDEIEDIKAIRHQNKRYTMRDIGLIEQRVQNLEYFTTLSWLEKQAINEQFIDESSGLPRVKTGIVVDPFTGHKIADVSTEDYKAAIDPQTGELRPTVETNQFRFELLDLKTDYATQGELNQTYESYSNIVVPKYTANTFVLQSQISDSEQINPFGIDSLTGSSDADDSDSEYPDVTQPPEIIDNDNGSNDSWAYCLQAFREARRNNNINNNFYKKKFLCYGREWGWWYSRIKSGQLLKQKQLEREIKSITRKDLIDENFNEFISSITAEVLNNTSRPNDAIRNLESIEYMLLSVNLKRRKRGVYFRGKGLKPNKKATVYLNDVNVTNYVLKPDVIQVQATRDPKRPDWIGHWRHDFRNGEEFKVYTIQSGQSKEIAEGRIDYIEKVTNNIANIHVYVSSVLGSDELSDRERVFITGQESFIKSKWFGRYWWKNLRKGNNRIIGYYPGYSLVNVATSNTVQLSPKIANSNLSLTNTSTITICSGDGAGERYNVVSYNASTLTVTIQGTFEEPLSGATTTVTKPRRKKPRGVWDYTTQVKTTDKEDRSTITFGDLYTDGIGVLPGLLMVPSILEDDDELGITIKPRNKNVLKITTGNTTTVWPPEPTANSNPLAQTFVVDPKLYPQGLDLVSVKLLFASKDDTYPVNIQIRNCTPDGVPLNGSSVNAVVSGASTYLNPEDVRVVDANTISQLNAIGFNPFEKDYAYSTQPITNFNESEPPFWNVDGFGTGLEYYTEARFGKVIHLDPGKTYAICIDTPSVDYKLYLATMGSKILGTNRTISVQPYVGTLFKTQANTTGWRPYPNQDLSFELTKANYAAQPAVVKLSLLVAPTTSNTSGIQGASDYFAGTPETSINVNAVHITTDENAFVNANVTYRIKTTLYNGSTLAFTPIEPDTTIEFYDDFGPRVITSNNESLVLEATLRTINPDIAPTFDVSKLHMITIENMMDDNSISNSDIFIPSNFGQDHNVQSVVVTISGGNGTGATAVANVTSSNTIDAIYIVNGGSGYTESPTITISDPNATINAEAVVVGEDQPFGGVADAKYITRRITLADGFNGGDLRVLFSAHKARNTEIDVYYKVLSAYDVDNLENKRWVKMTQIAGLNNYSQSKEDFKNYIYAPGKDNVPDNYINYDGWTNFKYFAIKIVMRGTNTNKVPRIKNFRAIALSELL